MDVTIKIHNNIMDVIMGIAKENVWVRGDVVCRKLLKFDWVSFSMLSISLVP